MNLLVSTQPKQLQPQPTKTPDKTESEVIITAKWVIDMDLASNLIHRNNIKHDASNRLRSFLIEVNKHVEFIAEIRTYLVQLYIFLIDVFLKIKFFSSSQLRHLKQPLTNFINKIMKTFIEYRKEYIVFVKKLIINLNDTFSCILADNFA